MKTKHGLVRGVDVYYNFKKATVSHYKNASDCVEISRSGTVDTMVSVDEIFMRTPHVTRVTEMVAKEYAKFREATLQISVNFEIDQLLTKHWIAMCNAEDDAAASAKAESEYLVFIGSLHTVTEFARFLSVSGIPFLKKYGEVKLR